MRDHQWFLIKSCFDQLHQLLIKLRHFFFGQACADTGACTNTSTPCFLAVITMVTLVLLLVAIFLGRAIWKKYRAKTSKHKKATAVGACEQRQVHCEQRLVHCKGQCHNVLMHTYDQAAYGCVSCRHAVTSASDIHTSLR